MKAAGGTRGPAMAHVLLAEIRFESAKEVAIDLLGLVQIDPMNETLVPLCSRAGSRPCRLSSTRCWASGILASC